VQQGLDKAADDGSNDGAANRGEDDKADGVLLLIWLPHVGHHAKGDRAACARQATEEAADDYRSEVRCERTRQLEDWEEQGENDQ
jgi:hypothetical protein